MRFLRRRRRDALTPLEAEIAREHLQIPGHPVPAPRRGIVAALREIDSIMDRLPARAHAVIVAAIITTCSAGIGSGIYAGVQLQADRQEERIEAEFWQASDRYWALADAYEAAYDAELKERGFSPEEIGQGHAAAFSEFVGGKERGPDLPAPQQAATLEIRDQLNEAEARYDALLDATDPD